ncbi:MAG: transglutaminase domain-containing protein, partial [Marinicellaceae bacterium]
MKSLKLILLLTASTLHLTSHALESDQNNSTVIESENSKKQLKIKRLQKDWVNGLLIGKDMSSISQSYAKQISDFSKQIKRKSVVGDNDFQQIFQDYLKKYQDDTIKVLALESASSNSNWKNKASYLSQSYNQAHKAQKKLLKQLQEKKQFLIDKKSSQIKIEYVQKLINQTTGLLDNTTHELLSQPQDKIDRKNWEAFLHGLKIKKSIKHSFKNNSLDVVQQKILRNNNLPYSGRNYSSPVLIQLPSISPSYANQNAQAGTIEDLQESEVVEFSSEISQLANDLNHDYIKILNYVRQNIALEIYAKGQKGASATLLTKAGNDVDQASLLIALLRKSNIPSRFVHGVIRQNIDEVLSSQGLSNPNQVLSALNKAGIAYDPVIEGGQVTAIRRQYTWVSAYIPYAQYRGSAADLSDKTWVPLAPAIKNDSIQSTEYFYSDSEINSDGLVIEFLTQTENQSPLLLWKNFVQADITENYNLNYADLLNRKIRQTAPYPFIPASLPFDTIVVTDESAQLTEDYMQSVTVQMGNNAQYLDVTLNLPEIAGKRLSLSYLPATVDDLNIVNQAGGMALVEPYLVDLRPVLKLDGKQIGAINAPLPMASFEELKITFNGPATPETFFRKTLIGNYLSLVITAQNDQFPLDSQDPNLFADETRPIRIMHNLAKHYNQKWFEAENEIAAIMDIALIKPIPALTIVSPEYNLREDSGLITKMKFKGVSIDAVTHSVDAISRNSIDQNVYDFYRISSLQGSYLESNIFNSQWAINAISADQGIRQLADNNTLLELDASNYLTQLSSSNHPQYIQDAISQWINRGYKALLMPKSNEIDIWNGSSWHIFDPQTGHSGYFISGVYAGGQTTQDPNDWANPSIFDDPYSEGENNDPLAGTSIEIIESSNYQQATVNTSLPKPLAVIVKDDYNNPVNDALVTFKIRVGETELQTFDEFGVLIGSSTDQIQVKTNSDGIAQTHVKLVEKIGTGRNIILNPGDTNQTRIGVTNVTALVETKSGEIDTRGYFEFTSLPDIANEIELIDCFSEGLCDEGFIPGSHFGANSAIMHFRVIDRFGNFVSNVPVNLNSLNGQPNYSAKFALKENCNVLSIFAPGCASFNQDTLSNYYWSTFTFYNGFLLTVPNEVTITSGKLGSKKGTTNIWYDAEQQTLPNRWYGVLFKKFFFMGPYGKYEAAAPSSSISLFRLFFERYGDAKEPDHNRQLQYFKVDDEGYNPTNDPSIVNLFAPEISISNPNVSQAFDNIRFDIQTVSLPSSAQLLEYSIELLWEDIFEGEVIESLSVRAIDYVYAVSTIVTDIIPNRFILNDENRVKSPIIIKTQILPLGYKAESVSVNYYKNDQLIFQSNDEYPNGNLLILNFDPKQEIDFNANYSFEIILNKGTQFEIKSEKTSLRGFQQQIVASVSGNNVDDAFPGQSNGGTVINLKIPNSIRIETSLYLNDDFVCRKEGFKLFLNSESEVVIEVEELDVDGLPTGSIQTILEETLLSGSNNIQVSADQIGTGTFALTIKTLSLTTGNSEIVTGNLHSVIKKIDNLSIGHPIIKGVDLATSSMVYSKKNLSLTAPGSDLEFIHTYSQESHLELGPMGYGWTHNYMSRVIETKDCADVIIVTGADGGSTRFWKKNGEIVPMRGYHSKLIKNIDGSYSFYSKNGTHYHYVLKQENVWWNDYIEDSNGNTLTIELQNNPGFAPIIISVTDSVDRKLIYQYETRTIRGRTGKILVGVSGPDGKEYKMSYTSNGHLEHVKMDCGNNGECASHETYEYSISPVNFVLDHTSNILLTITDEVTNAKRQYHYEDIEMNYMVGGIAIQNGLIERKVKSIDEDDAGITRFNFTPTNKFNSSAVVNQNGNISSYTMNYYGAATNISAPNGNKSMVWEISDEILLTSETDENGRTKSFTYDEFANLTSETIGSLSKNYTYLSPTNLPPYIIDRVKTFTDFKGATTTYTYDNKGNKIKESLGSIDIGYNYNPKGLVSSLEDGNGNLQSFTYDNYGQLISQTDGAGNTIGMIWDALGRKTSETDGNGNISTYTHDDLNRITSKTLDGRIWLSSYENGGLIKTETDPNGHATTYDYDKMGRLLNITNAKSSTFSYAYDENGNKLSENDFNGNITTFAYDNSNRLITKTEPLGKVTTYTYDNVGNVLTETTADRKARYGYSPDRYFLTSFTGDGPSEGESRSSEPSTNAVTTRTVDGEGNILTETDPNGNLTTFSYDAHNRLITEVGELGSGRIINYDNNGNVLSETTLNTIGNQIRTFVYDGANRRILSTNAESELISYTYDPNGNVLTQTMPLGKQTLFAYNNLNLVTSKTEANETPAVWSYIYDLSGNLITETQPNNNIITTVYDELNRPVRKTDSIGLIAQTTYDNNSNVLTEIDGNGNTTTHLYNGLNQRTSTTMPLGRGHTYTYTPFGEILTDTGPNGTITYSYNTLGQRATANGPNGYNESYKYDVNDNLKNYTDSRGNQTTYGINALNQTTSQTTGSFTQSMFYDSLGNKLTETDYRGTVSAYTFDKENRQLTFSRAGQLQQTSVYNSAGLLQSVKDANGNTSVHQYNAQYFKTQTNLPETQLIRFTPNAFGDITFQNNPGSNDTTNVYDLRRRLTSSTNGAGEQTQYEYDLNNNRTAVIKPDGARYQYTFDAANRLTQITNTAESITTTYGYSNKDNLTSIADAENKVTNFSFDNRNRKLSKTYPDGQSVNYSYDNNGNLKTVDLPNGVDISYNYDLLNRKTSESYSGTYGSGTTDYTLDANGNQTKVSENYGTLNFQTNMAYDNLDRMTSKTDVYGNDFQFSYDANGNRKAFKDHDNKLTNYQYDGLNRLKQLTHPGLGTFDWTFNNTGLTSKIDYPNGASVQYDYDSANRIASIENKKSGADISKHIYTYDSNGNRITMRETNIHINQLINYTYDNADRLTSVKYPNNQKTTYVMDKVGNRTREILTGTNPNTKTFSYNNRDQLTSITDTLGSNTTYTFDDAGNQLSKDENGVLTAFNYTARGRVKDITIGANNPINYQYDYSGQRINHQSNGQEKHFLYDGLTLIAETNTIGNTLARYHYGDR